MEWYHVYLFTRIDSIVKLIVTIEVISAVVVVLSNIGFYVSTGQQLDCDENGPYWREWERWKELWRKIRKPATWVLTITTLFLIAMPSQKEVAAIYLLPKISKSEFAAEASKIPTNVMELLNAKLQEYIDGVHTPAKEEKKK